MDYEKKYKEALKRASGFKTQEYKDVAAHIFPELQESEDEKIRKALIKYLNSLDDDEIRYGVSFKDMRAWLEKQGEKGIVLIDTFGYEEGKQKGQEEGIMLVLDNPQKYGLEKQERKPTWSEEDERIQCMCFEAIDNASDCYEVEDLRTMKNWLENIEHRVLPQPKWSEEDEQAYNELLSFLQDRAEKYPNDPKQYPKMYNWLKSLRPNHWKPSDEQMKVLKEACDEHWEPDGLDPLYTLYQDLKKLREE